MNPLRLEQMTVFDVEPAEVVSLAEELEIPMISLWTTAGMEGARPVTPANKGSVLERLRSSPVVVDTAEVFMLGDGLRESESSIALAAELGAGAIVVVNATAEEDRAAALLSDLCTMARPYGLLVSLEPIYMGVTRTVGDGLRLLKRSGEPNARLTVDLLHVYRSGTPLADLADIEPGVIRSAQICDGPASVADADIVLESVHSRMPPGTGSFDALGFLRVIPTTVPLGIEVPMRALREGGMSARDRTKMVLEATRTLQRRAAT